MPSCLCSSSASRWLPRLARGAARVSHQFTLFSLILSRGVVGSVLTGLSIFWCTWSAAKMFVHVLQMQDQRLLIAYPCMLLYGIFALMTVF